MKRTSWLIFLGGWLLAGCQGGGAGSANSSGTTAQAAQACRAYSGDAGCSECVSHTTCGHCDDPAEGYPSCQLRGDGTQPSSCRSGWRIAAEGANGCPQPRLVPPDAVP